MGGGVKGRIDHGEIDEFGREVVEDPVTTHNFDATILHLPGFDHERLTFYHNGIKRRLTNVHGEVVKAILQ